MRREEIRAEGLMEPMGHYTDAVRAGNLLFLSGCVALDEDGRVVGADDFDTQARQAFDNVGAVLRAAGIGFADVVKTTIYVTDIADRAALGPLRLEYFGASRPASTLVEVSALALPELRIEVDVVAVVPDG